MGTYILKRLLLMVPTFLLISLLVFIIINLAPGRAGQVQLTGGQGESVRETAGAREGYLLFKLGYGLDRPMLFNTRFALEREDVEAHLVTIARNLTATVPGEREALHVGEMTARIVSRLEYTGYWELTDRLAAPDLSDDDRTRLEAERLTQPYQELVIRPPRPSSEDLVEAQEELENWGMYAVPHLVAAAREHPNAKVRWQAVEFLTLNAQDRTVDRRARGVVARSPERQIERTSTAVTPTVLSASLATVPVPGLGLTLGVPLADAQTDGLRRTLAPHDVRNWHYDLNAPPDEVERVTGLWEDWFARNRPRFEHDFWDKVGLFFFDTRLALYWGNLFRGDLGVSSQYRLPVTEVIFARWKYSIYLSVLSILFAYLLSVPIGLYSAVKQGGLFDRGVGLLLFLFYSLPSFFVATLLSDYLTVAQEPGTVRSILHWTLRVLLVGVVPFFVAALYRSRAAERQASPAVQRRDATLAWVASAVVGLVAGEAILRLGVPLLAFLLIIAWPLFSTVRAWRSERQRTQGVADSVPFPVGRLAGLAVAGAGVTWIFMLLRDFFPAPVSGFVTEGIELNVTTWDYFVDVCRHLVFPVACLTYASLAILSRYARTGLLDVIRSDYIRTARAKGLSEPVVILKHAVRNGMIPILTLLATTLPALIGGSVIVEVIFGIPGLGQLIYASVIQKDFTVIMGVLQISAVLTLLGILLSDISYALVDPRISFD